MDGLPFAVEPEASAVGRVAELLLVLIVAVLEVPERAHVVELDELGLVERLHHIGQERLDVVLGSGQESAQRKRK